MKETREVEIIEDLCDFNTFESILNFYWVGKIKKVSQFFIPKFYSFEYFSKKFENLQNISSSFSRKLLRFVRFFINFFEIFEFLFKVAAWLKVVAISYCSVYKQT